VVRGVSFAARPGRLLALMGASGSGKTTVLRASPSGALLRRRDRSAGRRATRPPRGAALRELHARVGMVFQFHNLFRAPHRRAQRVAGPVHVRGPAGRWNAPARRLLDELGVGPRAGASRVRRRAQRSRLPGRWR
jgi:ABC-type polar amino acid transport system ATPase subunit